MSMLILMILIAVVTVSTIAYGLLRLASMLFKDELSEDSRRKLKHVAIYGESFEKRFGNDPANAATIEDIREIRNLLHHPELDDEGIDILYAEFATEVRPIFPALFDESYQQAQDEIHQERLARISGQ